MNRRTFIGVLASFGLSMICKTLFPQQLTSMVSEALATVEEEEEEGLICPFEFPICFDGPDERKVFLPIVER